MGFFFSPFNNIQRTIIPSAQVCLMVFVWKGTTHEYRHDLTGALFSSEDALREVTVLMENPKLQHQQHLEKPEVSRIPEASSITSGQHAMPTAPSRLQKTHLHQPPITKHVYPRKSSGGRVSWRVSSCNIHGDMKPCACPGTPQHGEIAWKSYLLPVWAFFFLHWECLWQRMKQNCTKALLEQNKTAHMRSTLGTAIAL